MQNDERNEELKLIQTQVQLSLTDLYQNNFGLAVKKLEDLNKLLLKHTFNPKADE